MLDDKLSLFDGQAITNANKLSTIIDLGSISDPGEGTPKYVNIEVDTAFSQDTSGEYMRIDLVASSGADPLTSDKVYELLPSTNVSDSFLLTQGSTRRIPIPPDVAEGKDHIGIAVIVTSALATGKLNADIRLE
jgi:hypothetical protein